jgi:hypothetical protein
MGWVAVWKWAKVTVASARRQEESRNERGNPEAGKFRAELTVA